ncbi:MAG TPA: helix-turn-helix transcriptional regulator, partial [Pseudomonadales bacterium]|nr:helix-turn-helix transcriptional regulator [Pseudomonadales bacterium]
NFSDLRRQLPIRVMGRETHDPLAYGHGSKRGERFSLSRGRVALLGIAQRSIRIKFRPKTRKQNTTKPLPTSIKTLGDLIQVKRVERNLTPGYLAARMGIAANLVSSWEDGSRRPDDRQLEILASLLGICALDNYTTLNSRRFG